jgi:hypothetical protein
MRVLVGLLILTPFLGGCGPSAGEKRLALALAQCEEGRAADRRDREASAKPAAPAPAATPSAEEKPLVTAEKFDTITDGMTLEKVNDIFGMEGDLKSTTNMAGYKTEMRQWANGDDGGRVLVTFRDGRVISRVQYGLRP